MVVMKQGKMKHCLLSKTNCFGFLIIQLDARFKLSFDIGPKFKKLCLEDICHGQFHHVLYFEHICKLKRDKYRDTKNRKDGKRERERERGGEQERVG